jgi:dihydropteroate synthase
MTSAIPLRPASGPPLTSFLDLAPWQLGHQVWTWQRSYIMGVLNLTPDSFSDGGEFAQPAQALDQAQAMIEAGADLLDLGGESTRPGADPVPLKVELQRVLSVVQGIRRFSAIPLSIDTTKAAVARAAIEAGATVINDVSGGCMDPEMLPTAAALGCPIILMHMRGTPQTMQQLTNYGEVVEGVLQELSERLAAALAAGIEPSRIALDPGLGFAKTAEQSWELLRRLDAFQQLGCPLVVGVSRKSMIGQLLNQPDPKQRVWGTAAACSAAIAKGAHILRVHDVGPMVDVCRVSDAIWRQT